MKKILVMILVVVVLVSTMTAAMAERHAWFIRRTEGNNLVYFVTTHWYWFDKCEVVISEVDEDSYGITHPVEISRESRGNSLEDYWNLNWEMQELGEVVTLY